MRSLLLPALLTLPLAAQDKPAPVRLTPLRVSPASTLSQEIGISKLDLTFARPAVKGRKIWGEVVPFGQVWRAGANSATVLTLSHAAKVAGKDVAAGSYGFFVIPGEKTWTLILNKKAKQWGARAPHRSGWRGGGTGLGEAARELPRGLRHQGHLLGPPGGQAEAGP